MNKNLNVSAYAREMNVSRMTVHRWIKKGMPCVKEGAVIRINVDEAKEWLKRK